MAKGRFKPTDIFFALCEQKNICAFIEDETGIVMDAADLWQIIRLCEDKGIIPESE